MGMFVVESSRLGIEIERESRGAQWRTRAKYEWRRTNLRELESVVTDYAARRSETMGMPSADDKLHFDSAVSAAGQGQFPAHQGLREDSLVERVTESVTY